MKFKKKKQNLINFTVKNMRTKEYDVNMVLVDIFVILSDVLYS